MKRQIWIRLETFAQNTESKRKAIENFLSLHPEIKVKRYHFKSHLADCYCLSTEMDIEEIAKECPISLNIFCSNDDRTLHYLRTAPGYSRITEYEKSQKNDSL